MKASLLLICGTAIFAASASADVTTLKTLYSGEPKEVTWENTLSIPADQFTENVSVGDYIYITFSETTDVIEIKSDGTWLPGSRYTALGTDTREYKAYITEGMLSTLRATGLEICGAKFTVTGVSICNDGFDMPYGAIWGGYFWIDSGFNSLELFKTAFNTYAGQRYMDIMLSDDAAGYTGYEMKVVTKWEPETTWATNDQIQHGTYYATVDLKDINVKESLADVNSIFIQGHSEQPFNITAVVLRDEGIEVGIEGTEIDLDNTPVIVYSIQGMPVMSGVTVSEARATLPAGLYIAGGRKFIVR